MRLGHLTFDRSSFSLDIGVRIVSSMGKVGETIREILCIRNVTIAIKRHGSCGNGWKMGAEREENTVKIIEIILHVPYVGNRWSSVPDTLCSRTGKRCAAQWLCVKITIRSQQDAYTKVAPL